MNRGNIDPPNNIHIYMFGDNIDPPMHTHGHGQPQHCPPQKTNTYTLTLTEATLTSNTCILTEEKLSPLYTWPWTEATLIRHKHMRIDMDRGDMNSDNISLPQTYTWRWPEATLIVLTHGHEHGQHWTSRNTWKWTEATITPRSLNAYT